MAAVTLNANHQLAKNIRDWFDNIMSEQAGECYL